MTANITDTALSSHVTLSQVNELDVLRIQNQSACATIALQGAHLFEYAPTGQANLLFVSDAESFNQGSAIRGGVPVCWPWFGAHSKNNDAPAHGFARSQNWQYTLNNDSDTRTDLTFWLETDASDANFPYRARVELFVSIGETLVMSLTTQNLGEDAFLISQALHSYFKCDDIAEVQLHGLAGACYQNKLTQENLYIPTQFNFNQEIDWVVREPGTPVGITGLGKHAIKLTRIGSRSLVLWNPWIDKSKTLSHFRADDYKKMVCVETANVSEDSRLVKARDSHVMLMEISTHTDEAS